MLFLISLSLEPDVKKNLSQLDYAHIYRPRTYYRTKSFTVNLFRKGFSRITSFCTHIEAVQEEPPKGVLHHRHGRLRQKQLLPKLSKSRLKITKHHIPENVTDGPLWLDDNGTEMQYSLQKLTEEISIQGFFAPCFFHPSIIFFFFRCLHWSFGPWFES